MTVVYFVRHAEPNYDNHDDMSRELTKKGLEDRKLVTDFLSDKGIDVVMSSPYKRSVDTVKAFADNAAMEIVLVEDFRERRVVRLCFEGRECTHIQRYNLFAMKQK